MVARTTYVESAAVWNGRPLEDIEDMIARAVDRAVERARQDNGGTPIPVSAAPFLLATNHIAVCVLVEITGD